MTSFQFQAPLALGLLLLIPVLALLPVIFRDHYARSSMRYGDVSLVATSSGSTWKQQFRPLLRVARLLAIALMMIGLARPQIVQGKEIAYGQGIDISLALDISGSMASLDFQPQNRLEAAKEVISSFVEERNFDRIGLVVFASEAFSQSPLTTDHNVFNRLLDQIELAPDLGIDDGTAIGLGLANAANMVSDSDGASQIVILLTDGVNNSGQIDPQTAAEAAKALGVKVYTIGMGKTGEVPVPVTDAFGNQRVVYQQSTLDEATLQEIADVTGGQYFRAENTEALQDIYDTINELETSEVEIVNYAQYQELAGWLLLPALLLIAGEAFASRTLFRRIP